jgi:sec-independent protein translocase protein TatA
MGAFSTFHWLLLLVIVLLLFGNRLPSVMRSLGRGVTEFKKGIEGVEDDDEDERRRMKDRKDSKESKESKDKPQQDA